MKIREILKVGGVAAALAVGTVSCEDSGGDNEPSSWQLVQSLTVPAAAQGTAFTAPASGQFRFTIAGGAYSLVTPATDWETELFYYKNRPVQWEAADVYPNAQHYDGILGAWRPRASPEEAEAIGRGASVRMGLIAGDVVIFIVPDCQNCFDNNTGAVALTVEQAVN
jgi:hypothetical protein